MRRLFALAAAAAACFVASTASAGTRVDATLEAPSLGAIAELSPSFVDAALTPAKVATITRREQITEWGGPTLATDGETVAIYFSDSYPQDPALQLKWANFMTSLVHGSELSTVTIHLAPIAQIKAICGQTALACYGQNTIYAPGDNPDPETTVEGTLAHEYGHHIAANRLNPPFAGVDYGTKRWATYENVCSRATTGALFPGAEDSEHYMLNPGEAFAESYRLMNEQKLGIGIEPWDIVSTSLYPDATALGLISEDVTAPWTADTPTILKGALTSKVRTLTFPVSTPLDGSLTIAAHQYRAVHLTVSLVVKGKTVGSTTITRATGRGITKTVCGQRSFQVKVSLTGTVTKSTKTSFVLTVDTP